MTPTAGPCDAWLLDADGLLYNSDDAARRCWVAWSRPHGLDDAQFEALHGWRGVDKIRQLAPHLDAEAEAHKITALEIADTRGVTAYPGAATLLEFPTVRVAIVSSAKVALAEARLRATGLTVPSVVVGGDTVSRGKPDPEPYLVAAARLGVDPADCTVFEDAPAGIAAGKAAGMRVVAVRTTYPHPGPLAQADVIVRDLSEYLMCRADCTR